MATRHLIVLIILVLYHIQSTPAGATAPVTKPPFNKKLFTTIGCTGHFSRPEMDNLERVCFHCAAAYRNQTVLTLCRQYCYHSEVFDACCQAVYGCSPPEMASTRWRLKGNDDVSTPRRR